MLVHAGRGTRKEIREWCKSGKIQVNGQCCRDCSVKIDPQSDTVTVMGDTVSYEAYTYIMLHKPSGVLSATEDKRSRTVLDLLPPPYSRTGLFPVGRLDKDTTGLLLLTNDGQWAHRIASPKKHIHKIYEADVQGCIPPDIDELFQQGIVLDDGLHCLPARASITAPQRLEIVVQEGKFHQVKRMCAAAGLTVTALHRRAVGALLLDAALAPGSWRRLTEEEKNMPFL